MKIWLFSDTHCEQGVPWNPYGSWARPEADVLVAAGDIDAPIERGVRTLRRIAGPDMPVVYVAGNHEHYGRQYIDPARLRHVGDQHGVTILNRGAAVIGGVRFLGCTLWTDYQIYDDRDHAMACADVYVNDHSCIMMEDGRFWRPSDAALEHVADRRWLSAQFRGPRHDGPTVVVTHHAPSPRSVEARFVGDPLTPAFASDVEDDIAIWKPHLWMHGHMHHSADYLIGTTRVVCNPRGYGGSSKMSDPTENPKFNPSLVIELPTPRPRPPERDEDEPEPSGWTI